MYIRIYYLFLHPILLVDSISLDLRHGTGMYDLEVIHGRYTRDIKNFSIVVPKKLYPNGSFYSHHLTHYFKSSVRKKRNLEEERVHYLLHFDGVTHVLELEPYPHITSPAMVVERRTRGSDLSGVTIHRPLRHLCHLRGSVRNQTGSRVAISTCNGLVGYIRTKKGIFFLEPLHGTSPETGQEHVHVVYKRSIQSSGRSCNVRASTGDWWSEWCSRLHELRSSLELKTPHKRSETGTSVQRWFEAMIAADKKFLIHHKDIDVEEYIICVMNMVSDMYHDASVGNLIDIVIVRIVYLEKEEQEMDLTINTDGDSTLDSFCKWQVTMNPKDVNHPNHHDVAVLFTRYDICSPDEGGDGCGLLGLARLGTACSKEESCCINEDSGLILGLTTTHEIGHLLGCQHDSPDESGCEPITQAGDSTVMNPLVTPQISGWSPCSRGYITGLFDSQMGECMLDEPKEHSYPLDDMPAGAFYEASEQCAFIFGPNYIVHDRGGNKLCEKLWCKLKEGSSGLTNGEPPADGTKCGPNKWCYNKECVEMGERPAAVNGEWGAWGSWSECSRTCGGGVSIRERHCNNPQPSNRGRYCLGKRHEYNLCNTQSCAEHAATFREVQCAEFNDKPYQGVLHTWKPYPAPDSDPNPCALYCLHEGNTFTKLAPRVRDGTRCKPGTQDTCIQGSCIPVGCDWKVGSDSVEDVCGVCNGDGTHCSLVDGIFKTAPSQGYVPIAVAPVGAINLRLEEVQPSENMIAVSAFNNQTYYLNGDYTENSNGEYSFGVVKGIYSKPEHDMDELHIKGPIKEPLVLYVCLFSAVNPGVRYLFAVPTDKPMYKPKYHWEFVEWGPCSAQCGGGTQIMTAACIEERDGKVKPSFCDGLQKEEPRARTCNDQPCRTRWKVWKWGPCSGCLFQSGTRSRRVECVKQSPTNTGDEEIITEANECCGEPPKHSELCNSPRPCPKNMTSSIVKKKKRTVEVMPIHKRESEGKSFSDGANMSTTATLVRDLVNPQAVHLQEVLLDDSHLNLTETEFEQLGDELPDKVLSCPIQSLTGKEAMDRLEEIAHGPGYEKKPLKTNKAHNATQVKHETSSTDLTTPVGTKSTVGTTSENLTTKCKKIKEETDV